MGVATDHSEVLMQMSAAERSYTKKQNFKAGGIGFAAGWGVRSMLSGLKSKKFKEGSGKDKIAALGKSLIDKQGGPANK